MAPSIITSNGNTRTLDQVSSPSQSINGGQFLAFDHVEWYVGNSKQASSYYVTRFGFKHVAYVLLPCRHSSLLIDRKV